MDENEKISFKDKIAYDTKVKRYRDGSFTVTYCNSRRFINQEEKAEYYRHIESQEQEENETSGSPPADENTENPKIKKKEIKDKKRSEERKDHMKRAVDSVYDIALQNEWNYFMTITIDPQQFDSKDPAIVYKKLSKWLNNCSNRKGLKYLLIPEYHEKGGIHAHALINDCFKLEHSGRYLYQGKAYTETSLLEKGVDLSGLKPVYNVPEWKYGYSTAIPVDGTPARLACYITKYITKDCKKIFGKYYLSSRNLNRDTEITFCNSEKFDDIPVSGVTHGYYSFKYVSDFRLNQNDDREVPDDILSYLEKHDLL